MTTCKDYFIDIGFVQTFERGTTIRLLFQLVDATNYGNVAIRTLPYREGGAPVSLTAKRPVPNILNEISKPPVPNGFGIPVDLLIVIH